MERRVIIVGNNIAEIRQYMIEEKLTLRETIRILHASDYNKILGISRSGWELAWLSDPSGSFPEVERLKQRLAVKGLSV